MSELCECGFLAQHEPPCMNETATRVVYASAALERAAASINIEEVMRPRRAEPSFIHDNELNELTIKMPDGASSAEWRRVINEILPEVLYTYHQKSVDYAGTSRDLGPRGQFSDMWRKLKKLKKALWDGNELVGEQPDEIINDLIAHCLLIKLDMKDGL